MGKLDEQIKLLQRKKAKIELFQRIIINLGKEKEALPEFPGLMKEVSEAVQSYCQRQISAIENEDSEEQPKKKTPILENHFEEPSMDDLVELKPAKPSKPKVVIDPDAMFQDSLKFVVHFKDWVDKPVKLRDEAGNVAQGTFVGGAFPNVKVRVGDKVIAVDPKTIELM